MKSDRLTIVVVGSGFSLSVCAAYLAEKLRYLEPIIIGVLLPQKQRESDLAFAFPPFSESLTPILRNQLTEEGLKKISIFSPVASNEFAFNFAPYGINSGAVTFPHAYEVWRQHGADLPSFDQFLGVQPSPSPGILYSREMMAPEFRQAAIRKRVVFVPSKNVSLTLASDGERICAVETSNGQFIAGDYFVDCTTDGLVMQSLQKKTSIAKSIIPSWQVVRRSSGAVDVNTTYQLRFDQSKVDCIGNMRRRSCTRTYDFKGNAESGEYFERAWKGNCVALGQGFARVPEFLIDLDRLFERQLVILCWLLGVNKDIAYASEYFNRISIKHLNEMIDVVNLFLRPMSTVQADLTDSNQRRINLFLSSSGAVKEDNLLISENCWVGLLHAVGLVPNNTNAVSRATDPSRIIDLTKSLLAR